jgi:hypothetical protein
MKFLDYTSDSYPSEISQMFDKYSEYLDNNRQFFSQETFEFATADWHYHPGDSRCPHDSWVESFTILEGGEEADGGRRIKIELVLFGAYHDGRIEIHYEGVRGYSLNLTPEIDYPIRKHGDWIIDEIRVTEDNWLVHEIQFWLDGTWLIECDNILYNWVPFDKAASPRNYD